MTHKLALLDADPQLEARFRRIARAAERAWGCACSFEFVLENGALFVTDCRPARTTGRAAIKIALDLFAEGVVTAAQAVAMIVPRDLWAALLPTIDPRSPLALLGRGLPAFAGVVSGPVVLSRESAEQRCREGTDFVFAREEITPDDLPIISAASGLLTLRGGVSSHGALVCRQIGKVGVTGLGGAIEGAQMAGLRHPVRESDVVTLNGATGEVFSGKAIVEPVNWSTDPHLGLLHTLLTVLARTDTFPPSHIGACWRLRDMLLLGSPPEESADLRALCRAWPIARRQCRTANVFHPMPRVAVASLFRGQRSFAVTKQDADLALVWQGLRQHLFQLLTRYVGIGRHPEFYRPLFDPGEVTTADVAELAPSLAGEDGRLQMIGEEFFGLNYHCDDYIRFDDIRLLAVVWCERPMDLWRIDATNPAGEKLLAGSHALITLKVTVNGAVVPHSALAGFYHYFRMREYRSDFSAEVSAAELRCFLRDSHRENNPLFTEIAREARLLDDNGDLTALGHSALERTDAKARRHLAWS